MHKINEDQIFELDPKLITVHEKLPRQRKDLGEIQKLMNSINEFGQILPIVINKDNQLIAGGRRLAACIMLNIKAKVCYKDTVDVTLMRELELEENIQRKNLTPSEECLAIKELVELKQKKYGKPVQGKEGGFTLNHAAELIGKTKGNIIEAIQIAGMVKSFPKLEEAKTKSEIKKAYKGFQRVQQNIDALSTYKEQVKKEKTFSIVNEDSLKYMKTLKSNSIDLLFTDPPYGINIFNKAINIGNRTNGNLTTTNVKYDDTFNNTINLLTVLAKESYRFTKTDGHAYIFCGKDRFIFQTLYDLMVKANWDVLQWPIIWIKNSSGQNNQPEKWPSSGYENILFARKLESHIIIQGKTDWIQCNPVKNRVHQAEKPVTLCKELISRVTIPGQTLFDPFCGSGAIIEAAKQMKLFSTGCEKDLNIYSTALARFIK